MARGSQRSLAGERDGGNREEGQDVPAETQHDPAQLLGGPAPHRPARQPHQGLHHRPPRDRPAAAAHRLPAGGRAHRMAFQTVRHETGRPQRTTRSRRNEPPTFTWSDTRGGKRAIQWLSRSIGLSARPRLRLQSSAFGRATSYGVSWMNENAGMYQAGVPPLSSAKTTRRLPEWIRSPSVGRGVSRSSVAT